MMSEESDKQNINIFEDLIDELKEANLIEEAVIETRKPKGGSNKSNNSRKSKRKKKLTVETVPHSSTPKKYSPQEPVKEATEQAVEIPPVDAVDGANFYRRQATAEVAFLRMVESAFADIERSQLKIVPTQYNDLEVNKALQSFLQSAPQDSAFEPSPSEFQLLQVTENWFSTLAERDKRIMTAHLRRYCESSHPPLSIPALIALARFYRNSPFTEQVRCKFDLVLTRIFSHEEDGSSFRELNFSRDELVQYIKELYAEWSSVPLYATETDDDGIFQIVAQFEDFIREAQAIKDFDQLLKNNFFNRLRIFKESTNEDFYAPPVAAVAVEINIYLGNRYIELLEKEKRKESLKHLEDKYGLTHDQAISEATGKTLTLLELLNQNHAPRSSVEPEPAAAPAPKRRPIAEAEASVSAAETAKQSNFNKWLLAALLLVSVAFGGYWAGRSRTTTDDSADAPPINLENSRLKDYLREARIEDGTLNGIVSPSWEKMNTEQRREALQLMMTFGSEKGFRRIELTNQKSEKVGIVTAGEIYVVE